MKIKLSAKDKNMVSLWWLLEIVTYALVGMDGDDAPIHKREMYREIIAPLKPMLQVIRETNDKFNDEIEKVFGADYENTLADTCVAIVTLLETLRPEQVTKVIKAAGITDRQIAENWGRGGGS
jgi:hypothetical protein